MSDVDRLRGRDQHVERGIQKSRSDRSAIVLGPEVSCENVGSRC
jgi:hypothetical protein